MILALLATGCMTPPVTAPEALCLVMGRLDLTDPALPTLNDHNVVTIVQNEKKLEKFCPTP